MVDDIDEYSDLAYDLDTIICFLEFQDTNLSSRKIQKLVIDFLVAECAAQLPSENVANCIVLLV